MKKLVFAVVAACGVFGFAQAEDLTVPFGETYDLPETATYDNVTVHGTLNIPSGLQLTATNVALGPDEGDSAVINVLGNIAASLKVTGTTTVGANGGTGKIVAMTDGTVSTGVLNIPNVVIAANATSSASGMVDFLEIGKVGVNVKKWENKHAALSARIRTRSGQLGVVQNYGATYFTGKFRIEGYDETSTVNFGAEWMPWTLNSGALTIAAVNQDVTFVNKSSGDYPPIGLGSGLTWEGVRDVILNSSANLAPSANDQLPSGPDHGILRVKAANASLCLGSKTVHLNGLDAASGPSKESGGAVRGTAVGKLVFGSGDVDGTLVGHIQAVLPVEKTGAGTLTVTGTSSLGTITVNEGTLCVKAAFDAEQINVAEGATLEIDGVTVTPSVGAVIRGNLVLKNGGRLVVDTVLSCEEPMRIDGGWSCTSLTKEGVGACIVAGAYAVSSNIHVKAGSLSFGAAGYNCRLFKWNVTNWQRPDWCEPNTKAGMFYLGDLALVDENGQWNCKGLATSGTGIVVDPADLAAGTAAFGAGHEFLSGCDQVSNLFDGLQYKRLGITSPLTTADGGVTLYLRLKDAANPAVAYDFGAAYGGCPKSWTWSGSCDNGATWKVLNEVTDFTTSGSQSENWFDGSGLGETVPKRFVFNSPDPAFVIPGVKNMPEFARIRVDKDAVLDFTNVTGGQRVNGVAIDAGLGGGKVKNAIFEKTGVIDIVGVTESLQAKEAKELPFVCEDSQGMENLDGWQVAVDGVLVPGLAVSYDAENGKFTVSVTVSVDYLRVTESGAGALTLGAVLVIDIDSNVAYTNEAALSGTGTLVKRGLGTLELSQDSSDFSGEIVVAGGVLGGAVTNAFGSGCVTVLSSADAKARAVIGSATTATAYDNNFVFAGDSDASYAALQIITAQQKRVDVNGSIEASCRLDVTDSGSSNGQDKTVVYFNGDVTAVGQTVNYPTDNSTSWNGTLQIGTFRAKADYPRMGEHCFYGRGNAIGRIELGYNQLSLMSTNALGGAVVSQIGTEDEVRRGIITFRNGCDQTAAYIRQDSRTQANKRFVCSDDGDMTLTLTGGVSEAWCQYWFDCENNKKRISLVVDAVNDDFVQTFSNSVSVAGGDYVVKNGTLRFAGASSATSVTSITVEGGAFELESTLENAFAAVTNVSIGADARVRISAASVTPFCALKPNLQLDAASILELPEGAAVTVHSAWLGTKRLYAGTYTGEGGPATAKVVPWISGAGTLTVKAGSALILIFR